MNVGESEDLLNMQLGWNCFDNAINLPRKLNITSDEPNERAIEARKALIEKALKKSSDSDYRELLAAEICNAAALTAVAMNAGNLESTDRNLLPYTMRTAELQNLYNDYNQVLNSDVVKQLIENCNNEIGFIDEKRKNINELEEFFQYNINWKQYSNARVYFKQARDIINQAKINFKEYCSREYIYRQYLQDYYGKNEWFAFQPDFSTSMVDVTAKLLNLQIVIYNRENIIHQTGDYGPIVPINFEYNHFTKFLPNASDLKRRCDSGKRTTTSSEFKEVFAASGVKHTLHGIAYQWKILMLLAKQCQKLGYPFRLATEKDDAGKFDDAVLLYRNPKSKGINYIFLQAKHIQEESALKRSIKEKDLLTEKDELFSLQKYYLSYQKIKRNYGFRDKSKKYFIIYTNINFEFNEGSLKLASLYFKPITDPNEILNIGNCGDCYQLDASKSETVLKLMEIFEKTSDCQKLAGDLAESILSNSRSIRLEGMMKTYQNFLAKYVFDLQNDKFNRNFLNGENDRSDIGDFRQIFLEKIEENLKKKPIGQRSEHEVKLFYSIDHNFELRKRRKLEKGKGDLPHCLNEFELKFSGGFKNIIILERNPQLLNPEEVANELYNLIENNKDKIINVARGNKSINRELNNLAGHVLVLKTREGKEFVGFNENFLIGRTLLGNILELRKKLMRLSEIKNKHYFKNKLDVYIFKISGFKPCKETDLESLLNTQILIPKRNVVKEEIESFLNHLIFMVNQPNENELSTLIGKEVGKEFNLIDDKLITSHFQNKILNWLKEKTGSYVTENSMQNFFDAAREIISQLVMIGPTSEYTKKLDEFRVIFSDFNQTLVDFLSEFENSPKFLNFVTAKNETILGSIQVNQILKKIPQYRKEDSYIFVRLNTFVRLEGRIISAFKKNGTKLLIIECDLDDQAMESRDDSLFHILTQENKKLLFISSGNNQFVNHFKGHFGDYKEMFYRIIFGDFSEESRDRMLQMQIDFQGMHISLNKLISPQSPLVESLSLVDLLKQKRLKIGESIPITYGYDQEYYIDRTFNKYTVISSDVFVDRDKGTFSDFLAKTNEEFDELCQKYPGASVHWLEKNEFGLIWRKTHGRLYILRKYILNSHPAKIFPTNTDGDIEELIQEARKVKVVIIADTAGMGKTTVLTHLSKIIKRKYPSYWVVRINLNNHTDVFKENKDLVFSYDETAIDFVTGDLLKIASDLEKDIFKYLLEQKKIVMMFDGFDEISPSYKDLIINLLRRLKETSIEQLWVTTRPHLKKNLEEELHQVAYTLKAFTVENQIEFLTKFWKKSLNQPNIDEGKIGKFSRELVEILSSSINDKDKEFTGIPLQSHMLAGAFHDEFKEYYFGDGARYNLPNKLDLLELYDKFLNRKYLVYVSEKNNPSVINVATIDLVNILKGGVNLRKIHQILAIRMLIPEGEKLLLANKKSRFIQNEKLSRIGIAQISERIDFVHRTFAEYYVADFLMDQLKKKKQSPKEIQEFLLRNVFLSDNYQIVRSFMNNFLKKGILPRETLRQYGKMMNDLKNCLLQPIKSRELVPMYDLSLSSVKEDLEYDEKNTQGRFENVYEKRRFPGTSSLKKEEDDIMNIWGDKRIYSTGTGGTIFHQAAQENNPYIIYFLLDILKDQKCQNLVKKFLLHKDFEGQTVWYGAALNGDLDMLSELWSTAENSDLTHDDLKELLISEDKMKRTSWHWATRSNRIDVLDKIWNWGKQLNLNLKEDLFSLKDGYDRTAWCWACQYGTPDIIEKIWNLALEEKCEKDLFSYRDMYGNIWHWVAQNNNDEVIEKLWLLKRDTADIPALWFGAAENGNVQVLEKLWHWYPNHNLLQMKNYRGKTAWMIASENNKSNVLDRLLQWTSNDDEIRELVLTKDNNELTTLQLAIDNDYEDMVDYQWNIAGKIGVQRDLLLLKDRLGITPWHRAIWMARVNLLEKLWEYSEDDIKNDLLLNERKGNLTIWFAAVSSGKADIFAKIRDITENHINRSAVDVKNQIEERIINALLAKEPYQNTDIWKAAIDAGVDMVVPLWNWVKEISPNQEDLKNPFLIVSIPKNRTIWHEALSISEPKIDLIEKLLSFSEEANLTVKEFNRSWLVESTLGKTPLGILERNPRQIKERKFILTAIENHYAKINNGSLDGLLNEFIYFAVANGYRVKVENYLREGADVNDYKCLQKAVYRKDWYISVMLMEHGAVTENLTEEDCNSLRVYIERYRSDDKEYLLEKIKRSE